MREYTKQNMLMARLLHNENDYYTAVARGVNEDSWDCWMLQKIWESIVESKRNRLPHNIISFFFSCDEDARQDLMDIYITCSEISFSTTNITWHLEKALGVK